MIKINRLIFSKLQYMIFYIEQFNIRGYNTYVVVNMFTTKN